MYCFKVRAWFLLNYECPNESLFAESFCNCVWITLNCGTSVKVCASCALYLCMNGLAERMEKSE